MFGLQYNTCASGPFRPGLALLPSLKAVLWQACIIRATYFHTRGALDPEAGLNWLAGRRRFMQQGPGFER